MCFVRLYKIPAAQQNPCKILLSVLLLSVVNAVARAICANVQATELNNVQLSKLSCCRRCCHIVVAILLLLSVAILSLAVSL